MDARQPKCHNAMSRGQEGHVALAGKHSLLLSAVVDAGSSPEWGQLAMTALEYPGLWGCLALLSSRPPGVDWGA
jgi:hypothetical protein